jgi:hypothetical protein
MKEQIESLCGSDNKAAYQNLQLLLKESRRTCGVYQFFDTFAEMLKSQNSYVRTRAIVLIAANSRWDTDFRVDELIGRILNSIGDEKPIAARQCIKSLPELALYKPDLRRDLLNALKTADAGRYAPSMQKLIHKDIVWAAEQIEKMLK